MKTYLKDTSKIFIGIGVISSLVVIYGYLFELVEYVHSHNAIVGGGLGTFVVLSIIGLVISVFMVLADLHDKTVENLRNEKGVS